MQLTASREATKITPISSTGRPVAYATSTPICAPCFDTLYRGFNVEAVQVGHLDLGDLGHMLLGDLAHLVLIGLSRPFSPGLTAALMSTGTGGVLVMNVRSGPRRMVITTGMISPSWSFAEVLR